MQIPEDKLQEFKKLYKKRFNKDLSDQEAFKIATNLLNMMKLVYKPIKKSDSNKSDNIK